MPGQQRLDVAKVVRRRHEAGGGQHPSKGKRDPGHTGTLPLKPRMGSRFFGGKGRGTGSGGRGAGREDPKQRGSAVPALGDSASIHGTENPRQKQQRLHGALGYLSPAQFEQPSPPRNHPVLRSGFSRQAQWRSGDEAGKESPVVAFDVSRVSWGGWRGRRWLDVPGPPPARGRRRFGRLPIPERSVLRHVDGGFVGCGRWTCPAGRGITAHHEDKKVLRTFAGWNPRGGQCHRRGFRFD